MTDYIIGGILVVMLALGIRSTIKHFRHESSCCGGGTYKARRKKLNQVIARKVFSVEGMTCQHCVNRVQEAVNSIEGASGVVNLKKGTVTVSMEREIGDEVILKAVEKAGYAISVGGGK